MDCLEEISRTLNRLYDSGLSDLIERNPSQSFQLSADAVAAKAQAELGKVSLREGRYADALHHFASAAANASYAAERYLAEGRSPFPPVKSETMPMAPTCDLTSPIVEEGLDNINPGEITSIFLRLKAHGQASDWAQVAQDCRVFLGESNYAFGSEPDSYFRTVVDETEYVTEWVPIEPESVRDEKGETLNWREFWHAAHSWASAQLSPNEYIRLREEDEKKAAGRRLKSYFFGNSWDELPQRAKDRLVVADTTWNTQERLAWEAILADLRIAAEDVFDKFIFQPLYEKRAETGLELVRRMDKARFSTKRSPLYFFSRICRSEGFGHLLKSFRVGQKDIDWLGSDLPNMLDWLRRGRNSSEHGGRESWHREEVRPFIQAFLGIGQEGALPKLARVGRVLRQR